jgi:hypothetical protein
VTVNAERARSDKTNRRRLDVNDRLGSMDSTYLSSVFKRLGIVNVSLDTLLAAVTAVTARPTCLAPIARFHGTEA